jgi:mannose-6-phosphate isomerase-like protein (cupin superfamily)
MTNGKLIALLSFLVCTAAHAADVPIVGGNADQMKYGPSRGLPTCVPSAIVNGDPSSGAYIVYARVLPGCVVPWHWHTANEHLMIVSGLVHLETKDGQTLDLHAGGFALMPSHHVHQASCANNCSMYIYSDGAFDIHYVDKEGKELAPDIALLPFNETPGNPHS